MESLWPKIEVDKSFTSPVSILKEQGSILLTNTDGAIDAKVEKINIIPEEEGNAAMSGLVGASMAKWRKESLGFDPSEDIKNIQFKIRYVIVAKNLGGYKYELFKARIPLEGYPMKIFVNDNIMSGGDKIEIQKQENLLGFLHDIFNSSPVRRVLTTILSQTNEV